MVQMLCLQMCCVVVLIKKDANIQNVEELEMQDTVRDNNLANFISFFSGLCVPEVKCFCTLTNVFRGA